MIYSRLKTLFRKFSANPNYTVIVNVSSSASKTNIGREIIAAIRDYENRFGNGGRSI